MVIGAFNHLRGDDGAGIEAAGVLRPLLQAISRCSNTTASRRPCSTPGSRRSPARSRELKRRRPPHGCERVVAGAARCLGEQGVLARGGCAVEAADADVDRVDGTAAETRRTSLPAFLRRRPVSTSSRGPAACRRGRGRRSPSSQSPSRFNRVGLRRRASQAQPDVLRQAPAPTAGRPRSTRRMTASGPGKTKLSWPSSNQRTR